MRRTGFVTVAFAVVCLGCLPPVARAIPVPPHQHVVNLFDGHGLGSFDLFVKQYGTGHDPDGVFRVEDGNIHISGTEYGYLITRRSFSRFYLRAEFKWGQGTYMDRAGKARDSGILYYVQGPNRIWPRSVEFQVMEGGTGDFWLTDGAALTGKDGKRVTGPPGSALKIDRFGKGPSQNVTGFRDPVGEVEKPHGEWNLLELVTDGKTVRQYVNGKLVNQGTDPFPSTGKILLQSEGAEVYFRNVKVYPLK